MLIEPSVYIISDLIASVGYPGLAFLMAMDATILPVPSAAVLGFAGYLCYQGRFDLFAVTLVGALGSTGGSVLMYGLGRWGGRPFLDRYGKYIGLGERKISSADGWFTKYGDWAVLLSQLLPVARDLIPFPAGIIRMKLWRFALLSFLGSLPFCLGLTLIGFASGPGWEAAIEAVDRYDMVVLLIVLVPLVAYAMVRLYNRRRGGSQGPRRARSS